MQDLSAKKFDSDLDNQLVKLIPVKGYSLSANSSRVFFKNKQDDNEDGLLYTLGNNHSLIP